MVVDNKYNFGDIVFLATDNDQNQRIVTGISILPGDVILYDLSYGSCNSSHYEFEITAEKNVLASSTN